MNKAKQVLVDFLTDAELEAACNAVVAETTKHCDKVRKQLAARNGMPDYFSAGSMRTAIEEAIRKVNGKALSGYQLLTVAYDARLQKVIDKELRRQRFKYNKSGTYVWPIDEEGASHDRT